MTDDAGDASSNSRADPTLDSAVDELYAADLDQFIPRRAELAKAARSAGDKDGAKAIAALRKPTQSAFTINRLARTDPSVIDGLIEVGTEMRQAQRSADGPALRELNARRRSLLDGLTKRAFEIIGQQSPSAGQREEVAATLTAALADAGIAELLQQGILVRAAESSGFGFSPPELTLIRSPARTADTASRSTADTASRSTAETAATADPATKTDAAAVQRRADTDREAARRQARADREQAQQATREKLLADARAEADAADTGVKEAVEAIEAGRQLITTLGRQLTDARRALEEAQKQAKLAETRQRKAREALNKASG